MKTLARAGRILVVTATAAAVCAGPAHALAAPPRRVVVPGQLFGVGGKDRGATALGVTVKVQVFLAGDPAGLARYASAVSDPRSARYRHFLDPHEARDRFEISSARSRRVLAWLRSEGLTPGVTDAHQVTVSGTVGDVNTAFATTVHTLVEDVGPFGTYTSYRPRTAVSVPSTIAAAVAGVAVLDPAPSKPRVASASRPTGKGGTWSDRSAATATTPADPCPATYGHTPAPELPKAYGKVVQWAPCGYDPGQLRALYGANGVGDGGRGVTVAVIGLDTDDTITTDLDAASRAHGEPTLRPGQFVRHVAADAESSADDFEFTQDAQAVHAMAPHARIDYVVGDAHDRSDRFLNSLFSIVDRGTDDVVTASLLGSADSTTDPAAIAAWEQALQLAAAEGISVDVASGDFGDTEVDWPTSSPWVTSVGGTTPAIGGGGKKLWEIPWADYTASLDAKGAAWAPTPPGDQSKASSGGRSGVIPQPGYQRGIVPPDLAGHPAMRTIPDIAADADEQLGLQVVQSDRADNGRQVMHRIIAAGTSLSSPLFAGLEALVVERSGRIGAANAALYARAGIVGRVTDRQGAHSIAFATTGNDDFEGWSEWRSVITHPSTTLLTPGQSKLVGLPYRAGYDLSTGLGTPTHRLLLSFGTRH